MFICCLVAGLTLYLSTVPTISYYSAHLNASPHPTSQVATDYTSSHTFPTNSPTVPPSYDNHPQPM